MSGDYSWDHSSKRYIELYRGLIGEVPLPKVEAPAMEEPNPVVVAEEKKH